MIPFDCQQCSRRVEFEDGLAGSRQQCPNCQALLEVPRTARKGFRWSTLSFLLGACVVAVPAALSLLGALVWSYAEIEAKTGSPIRVCYLTKPLHVDERLTADHVESVELPGAFAKRARMFVTEDRLNFVVGRNAVRNLHEGEPLLLSEFEFVAEEIGIPVAPGKVRVTFAVDSGGSPGELLHIGTVVNLLGSFKLGSSATPDKLEAQQIRVRRVQVIGVNGTSRPGPAEVSYIRTISVDVSEETSNLLKKLESRQIGNFTIEIMPESTMPAAAGEEISPVDKGVIAEQFGQAATSR